MRGLGRTTLGYRHRNGLSVCGTPSHIGVLIDRRALRIENTEYFLDLQLVFLNLPPVMLDVWCANSPLENPLDFADKPDAVLDGQQTT
jgi:hypothetical protein